MTNQIDCALEVDGLSILRGARYLCRNLSFAASGGSLVHVRGPNGCGKTSLMRTLAGLSLADSGSVRWFNEPLKTSDPVQRSRFAYLGHANGLKSGLSPRENLQFSCALNGDSDSGMFLDALEKLGVAAQADLPCRYLSAGQKRRVAVARVASSNKPVWILDEPFSSLDVTGIAAVTAYIGENLRQGGLVIMSSHQDIPLSNDRLIPVNMEAAT